MSAYHINTDKLFKIFVFACKDIKHKIYLFDIRDEKLQAI